MKKTKSILYPLCLLVALMIHSSSLIASVFPQKDFESQFDSLLYSGQTKELIGLFDDWLFVARQSNDSLNAMASVYRNYGDLYFDTGKYELSKTHYLSSLEYGLRVKDTAQLTSLLCSVSSAYFQVGDYANALKYINHAVDNVTPDASNIAYVYNSAGMVYNGINDIETAKDYYQKSIAALEHVEDRYAEVQVMICMGNIESNEGDYFEALTYYHNAVDLAGDQENLRWFKLASLLNSGNVYSSLNDLEQALSNFKEVKILAEKYGHRRFLLSSLVNITYVRLDQNDTVGIYEEVERQVILAKQLEDSQSLLESINQKAEVFLKLGKIEQALTTAQEAVLIAEKQDKSFFKAISYMNLGNAYLEKKNPAEAQRYCIKAESVIDSTQSAKVVVPVYLCLHKAAKEIGDYKAAYAYLKQYQEVKDSLLNEESIRKVNTLTVQQEYDEKILIERLKNEEEQRINAAKLQQQRKVQLLIFVLFVLALLSAVVLYRNVRNTKRYTRQLEQLNLTLQQKRKEVIAINQKIDQFAHSVSHDIINRLNNVALSGALVDKNELNSLQAFRSKTLSSMNNLITYCKNLLNWSDRPLNQLEGVVDLDKIVGRVVAEYQPLLQTHRVDIVVGQLPQVKLSPAVAEQVLVNLIDNAIKYSKEAQPNPIITISASQQDSQWVIQVADNGRGIPASELGHIFNRTINSRGLSFVKQNLESYNHRIWAENNAMGGANFYFTVGMSDFDQEPTYTPADGMLER